MRTLTFLLCLLVCGQTQAASLRSMTTLHGPTVYLRDLFDDAGGGADRVLGPGPEPGGRIVVEAAQLNAIALVTVLVNMNDAANLKNVTSAARTSSETGGIRNFFGLEAILPKAINPATLVSASSANNNTGTGQIQRTEAVTLRLAGVVTQVLPNGNLVVAASQEFLVNSELRELRVTGVIRPQDIASDNTVLHDRMAEARIAYGGKGQLTDLQRARWGQQMLDILAPF
jgi:hypothetical protein